MKNILVPVEDHAHMPAVLACARACGALFGSRVEGVAVGPDTGDLIAADFAIAGTIFDERTRREIVDHARDLFERDMRLHGVPEAEVETGGLSYAWGDNEMLNAGAVGSHGRLFDVVAVARPGTGRRDPRHSVLEAALFESGRPVLIAPHKQLATFGRVAVISWNRSTETARTLSFAMPLLKKAERVVVLTVSGALAPGPEPEGLVAALARHGLPVEMVNIDSGSRPAGREILEQAAALGADLLIKGGYTQSRLRQMIFGGPTNDILAHAELPVLMAH